MDLIDLKNGIIKSNVMLGNVEFRWIHEEVHHRNHHFVTFSQKVNCTFDLKVVNQNLQKMFHCLHSVANVL